jgi:hypothetical protein
MATSLEEVFAELVIDVDVDRTARSVETMRA